MFTDIVYFCLLLSPSFSLCVFVCISFLTCPHSVYFGLCLPPNPYFSLLMCPCQPSLFLLFSCLSLSPASGVAYSEVRRPCRLMMLLNPNSGRGQALSLFTAHIQRMLTEAAVSHTLVITGQSLTRPPSHSLTCTPPHTLP